MLAKLKALHDELLAAISGLTALTDRGLPDRSRLADQRLALSRASAARSLLLELEIYPYLLATLPAEDAQAVRRLRTEALAQRVSSAGHVGRWTIDAAMADWPGYCEASRAMRTAMRQQIAAEQSLLYKHLEVPARNAA